MNISDAETVGYASDISDAKTIQYAKPYKNKSRLSNQYRLKAKKKTIKTLRKKRTEPDLKVTKVVRPPSPEVEIMRVIPKITPKTEPNLKNAKVVRQSSPEVEITRVIPKITPNADYGEWANEIIFKGKTFAHPKTRNKIKDRRLAHGNSVAVKTDFAIDPEDYIEKPLVFDLKTTNEDEVFDWLLTNMAVDNDIYYIEHEEGANVFRIRKDN